jgi:hypothetical protein
MTSKQQRLVAGAIVVLVVGGAAIAIWKWRPSNNANLPDGTFWVCGNDQCRHEFAMTLAQFSDYKEKHPGAPVVCPKCGKDAVGANRCSSCNRMFPKGRGKTCPHCNKPVEAPAKADPDET